MGERGSAALPVPGRGVLVAYAGLTVAAASRFLVPDPPGAAWLWSQIAYGWWVAVTTTVVHVALGRAVLRVAGLRLDDLDRPSRLLLYLVGGLSITHLVLLALAVSGALSTATVLVYLLAAVSTGTPDLVGGVRRLARSRLEPPSGATASRVRMAAAILGVIWVAPYLVQTFLPNSDWDAALHHLPMARRLIEGLVGELDPAFAPWAYPGAMHLLYAMFLSVGAEAAITPFNFVAATATLGVCFLLARRIGGPRAGTWAAIVLLGVNIVWELGLDARIDGFLALFFLVACYGVVLWLEDSSRHSVLVLVGAAVGLMLGTKYTGLLLAAFVAIPVLAAAVSRPSVRGRASVAAMCVALLVALVPSSYWYARNAVVLGDPVFAFLGGRVFAGSDGSLHPYADAHEALARRLPPQDVLVDAPFHRFFEGPPEERIVEPANLLDVIDVLRNPHRYARTKTGHTISALLLLFFLLPLVNRTRTAVWLWVVGVVSFAVLGAAAHLLRYALPVWPLLSVGAGIVIARLDNRVAVAGIALVALGQVATNVYGEAAKVHAHRALQYLGGDVSRLQWLERVGYHNVNNVVPTLSLIDALHRQGTIESSDVILMVGEGKGYLLPTRYLPDHSKTGYRWLAEAARHGGDPAAIARDLARRGVRFILFNHAFVSGNGRVIESYHDESLLTFFLVDEFIRQFAQPLHDARGIMLLEVRPPG